MPSQKLTQAQLADIIGDPHAEEAKWMAACVVVGEKSLVKDEQTPVAKKWMPVAKWAASRCVALNAMFSVGVTLILAERYAQILGGPADTWITHHAAMGACLGMFMTLFGALGFWREFSGAGYKWLPPLWLAAIAIGAVLGICDPRYVPLAATIACSGLGFYTMTRLGKYARKALPPTFRADRTLLRCGLASIPGALVMLYILAMVAHPGSASSPLSAVSVAAVTMNLFFVMLTTSVPVYVCTRVSQSSSVASCMALNTLYSAPLVSGLFLAATINSFTAIDPANLINSGAFVLAMWAAVLSATAAVAGGSYLGAKRNAGINRRKLSRENRALALDG